MPRRSDKSERIWVRSPVWVVTFGQSWTMVVAINRQQAELIALGWAVRRNPGEQYHRHRVKVRSARAEDIERARSWATAGADGGDPEAKAMLDLIERHRRRPPAAEPTGPAVVGIVATGHLDGVDVNQGELFS